MPTNHFLNADERAELDLFRQSLERFCDAEIEPPYRGWERAGRRLRHRRQQDLHRQRPELRLAGARRLDRPGRRRQGRGELTPEAASALKLHASELMGRVADQCLQLFGGYGYMAEYPISRFWTDARVLRIYGGTSEIMKELVARGLLGR